MFDKEYKYYKKQNKSYNHIIAYLRKIGNPKGRYYLSIREEGNKKILKEIPIPKYKIGKKWTKIEIKLNQPITFKANKTYILNPIIK